jgi:hypothetical protein
MQLTRAELFELVWAEPRSVLCKRFGVSDVALAKKCRAAEIPMPGRGHWAKLAAGQKSPLPQLSLRLPGRSDRISFGNPRYGEPYSVVPNPQAPVFTDSVEQLVDGAQARIGAVRAVRDLQEPHSGMARILKKEQQRREDFSKHKWDYYAPHFADPSSQRQLRLFCALLRAFDRVGVKGQVSEESEWKPGIGTTYHLRGGAMFGDTYVSFRFFSSEKSTGSQSSSLSLQIGSASSLAAEADGVWSDTPGQPLEKQLTKISSGLLTHAELALRSGAQHRYEWQVNELKRLERERHERHLAELAEREATLAREAKRRRETLFQLVVRRERSDSMRKLVSDLKSRHARRSDDPAFKRWCEFALTEADRIDPLLAPLEEVIEGY